jgi:D-arabinose 1-dehydrogenase-like Zn-dependent alcohol dehydrogenase
MGIRLAKAMGATVTAVSSSTSKKAKAIEYGEEHKSDHSSSLSLIPAVT